MDAAAIPGAWKKTLWQALALAPLLLAAYLWPALAVPFSLLLPLVVCPAMAGGALTFALALPCVLAGVCWLGGASVKVVLLLPLAPYLCLLSTSQRYRRQFTFEGRALACTAAVALEGLALLLALKAALGGPVFTALPDALVAQLTDAPWTGALLYRLVNLGVLPLPDAYANTAALQLGNLVWLNPLLQSELLNMLRLRLADTLTLWVPMVLVQGSMLVGMFTALTTERAHARHMNDPAGAPLFRTLRLPRTAQGYVLVLCLGALLASLSDDPFLTLLGMLLYAAFMGVVQLLGAATLVALGAKAHPKRIVLYGVLAAALFALFPIALFLLGVADQLLNLRAAGRNHQEEE